MIWKTKASSAESFSSCFTSKIQNLNNLKLWSECGTSSVCDWVNADFSLSCISFYAIRILCSQFTHSFFHTILIISSLDSAASA